MFENGRDNIAREGTLAAARKILKREDPDIVVEVGTGIGVLAHTILENSGCQLYTFEDHEWCRKEARKNLADFEGRFTILYSHEKCTSPEVLFIDGGGGGEKDNVGMPHISFQHTRAVYIDGVRKQQRQMVRKRLFGLGCRFDEVRHPAVYVDGKKEKGGLEFCNIQPSRFHAISYAKWSARAFLGRLWCNVKKLFSFF